MYLWYVFDFLSSFTIIYVFLVANIPIVHDLFPDVIRFTIAGFFVIFTVSDFIGWLHFHKMGTYAAEQDIAMESSPYTMKYLTKVLLPFMVVVYELGVDLGLDHKPKLTATMKECETIIKDSEERWRARSKR